MSHEGICLQLSILAHPNVLDTSNQKHFKSGIMIPLLSTSALLDTCKVWGHEVADAQTITFLPFGASFSRWIHRCTGDAAADQNRSYLILFQSCACDPLGCTSPKLASEKPVGKGMDLYAKHTRSAADRLPFPKAHVRLFRDQAMRNAGLSVMIFASENHVVFCHGTRCNKCCWQDTPSV